MPPTPFPLYNVDHRNAQINFRKPSLCDVDQHCSWGEVAGASTSRGEAKFVVELTATTATFFVVPTDQGEDKFVAKCATATTFSECRRSRLGDYDHLSWASAMVWVHICMTLALTGLLERARYQSSETWSSKALLKLKKGGCIADATTDHSGGLEASSSSVINNEMPELSFRL